MSRPKGTKCHNLYTWQDKKCKICGQIFQTTGPHQNYCSMPCRFADYPIDKISDPHGCWVWTGTLSPKGYGEAAWNGRMWSAHRVSWRCFYGEIPNSLCVCHSCHNPACVNPEHLYLGTSAKNMYDSMILFRLRKKLTPQQVKAIKKLSEKGMSNRKIAPLFSISPSMVGKIHRGQCWAHLK